MQEMLEKVAEEIPQEFYRELNGGIILLPEIKKSSRALGRGMYTLGEYIVSPSMGRYIAIYYGSFERLYGDSLSEEEMQEEIRDTLIHEFTHHLEDLAGENELEKEDERQLNMYNSKLKTNRFTRPRKIV